LAEIASDVEVDDIFWKNPSAREVLGDDFPG
jgi:hypothetical protein